ncbi:M48 family metalloprotease [Membranicola marinus]|uniref:M48 family metalloprotease n=2 Tax=Membranihabitans marinus TaxID=1227546 RepID=A0A953L933_9BACT|nr:M48 family metalloprotease [Membranihabitans marinus]
MRYIFNPLIVTIALLFLSSCSRNPVTGKKELNFMSESQEIAMGEQSDPDVVAQFGLFEDETLQNFIDKEGQKMVKISHRPDLDFEFKILNSPVVNAFALPGGYVYFTRGILAHFSNEAEFAGVLGHEIGHVTARHGAEQYTNQILSQVGLMVGLVVSPTVRQFANEISQGVQLMMLSNSRSNESQSDKLGVEYSTKIGYDANQMANFFRTIGRIGARAGANEIPDFLSTHPNPADRFSKVHELAEKWQQKLQLPEYKINRDSYLEMIDGIIYGEDPREGYTDNNVFYHPELRFSFPYPSGWQLVNTPQQVQMAPKDQNAMMVFSLAPAKSLREAADGFVQQFKLTVSETNSKTVNGYPSYQMVADQVNEQDPSQSVRLLTYFYQDKSNNVIYQMLGVAPRQEFNSLSNYFMFTMDNFKTLRDPARINVQPDHIRIVSVPASMTLAQALRRYNMPADRFDELAILNSMELSDKLNANEKIKVISKGKSGRP